MDINTKQTLKKQLKIGERLRLIRNDNTPEWKGKPGENDPDLGKVFIVDDMSATTAHLKYEDKKGICFVSRGYLKHFFERIGDDDV